MVHGAPYPRRHARNEAGTDWRLWKDLGEVGGPVYLARGTLTTAGANLAPGAGLQLLVTDLLPAGFEIDNPSLVDSAALANFDWIGQTETAHLEFRSDRFVAAINRGEGENGTITLAYVVRAVTPGTYDHPAASVEDMYRPQFAARTATGRMEVRSATP